MRFIQLLSPVLVALILPSSSTAATVGRSVRLLASRGGPPSPGQPAPPGPQPQPPAGPAPHPAPPGPPGPAPPQPAPPAPPGPGGPAPPATSPAPTTAAATTPAPTTTAPPTTLFDFGGGGISASGTLSYISPYAMQWDMYNTVTAAGGSTYDNVLTITVPKPNSQCDDAIGSGTYYGPCDVEYPHNDATPEYVNNGFDSSVCSAWTQNAAGDYTSSCQLGQLDAGNPVNVHVVAFYEPVYVTGYNLVFSNTVPSYVHFSNEDTFQRADGSSGTVVGAAQGSNTDSHSN